MIIRNRGVNGNVQLYQGDCLEVLKTLPDESYTAVLTDPPYGLSKQPDMAEVLAHWLAGDDYKHTGNGFMGRDWDSFVPGPAVWREVYRVCKPGAVLMAFGGTRTEDLLSMAIRLAGWERFDRVEYLYGSGFPKSLDVGKAIDQENGAEREVVGESPYNNRRPNPPESELYKQAGYKAYITLPATDAARTWHGYGTSLKPAHESILLFRKPRTKTYAQHAVEDGTGALWVDGTRVATDEEKYFVTDNAPTNADGQVYGWAKYDKLHKRGGGHTEGRWPSNIIWDGSDEVAEVFARAGERTSGKLEPHHNRSEERNVYGTYNGTTHTRSFGGDSGSAARFFQVCPQDHPDAARFFYASKASRRERNAGLEGMEKRVANTMDIGEDTGRDSSRPSNAVGGQQRRIERGLPPTAPRANHHPCIKPLSICEYLSRLILPPVEYREDARLLVPFCGSGSEMVGALLAGWLNIDGIDKDEDEHCNPLGYLEIAERRVEWWAGQKKRLGISDPSAILKACSKPSKKKKRQQPMLWVVVAD